MTVYDSEASRLTEKIMAAINRKFPQMPTHQYNPIWSAVYETLQSERKDTVGMDRRKFQALFGGQHRV